MPRSPFPEAEPDIALLARRADFYRSRKPTPADTFVVIEVADSSLEFDRTVKYSLYAGSGVPECWIVNLVNRCLEIWREPQPDGSYRQFQRSRPGERVVVQALPGVASAVAEILPPKKDLTDL